MQLLEETEAVLHGHFLLTSGLHSPMYVEKFNVLQHPKYTEKLCQELAERYAADNVELVVGPMKWAFRHLPISQNAIRNSLGRALPSF